MSLVNDMLKDLERRQAGRAMLDGETFAGLGSVEETLLVRSRARRWLIAWLVLLALLLGVTLAQRGVSHGHLLSSLLPALPPAPAAPDSDGAAQPPQTTTPVLRRKAIAGPTPRVPANAIYRGKPSSEIARGPADPGAGAASPAPAAAPAASMPAAASASIDGPGSARIVAVVLPEKDSARPEPNGEQRAAGSTRSRAATPRRSPGAGAAGAEAAGGVREAGEGVERMSVESEPSDDLAVAFAARAKAPSSAPARPATGTDDRVVFTKTRTEPGVEERAGVLYHRARAAIDAGDPLRGESLLQEALAVDAGFVPAREVLVARRIRQGRLAEAQMLLARGLQAVPEHAAFAKMYARLLVDQGADGEALRILDRHAPEVPGDPQYHAFRAALLQRVGDHDLAVAVYRDVLRVRPDAGVWWMGLGISLEVLGRVQAARDAYRRAEESGALSGEVQDFVRGKLAELAG